MHIFSGCLAASTLMIVGPTCLENAKPIHTTVSVSPITKILQVPGFRFDVVENATSCPLFELLSHRTDRADLAKQCGVFLGIEEECRKLIQEKSVKLEGDVFERYCWTLVGACPRAPEWGSTCIEEDYRLAMDMAFKEIQNTSDSSDNNASYFVGWKTRTVGRAFFVTSKGRFGLGPAEMKPNDTLCVFYAGAPAYVLRFEAGKSEAQFIGEAYIHDLFGGDTKAGIRGRGSEEVFWIA